MARQRVSGRQVARHLGWTANYISRRLSGRVPFDVADLAQLAAVLRVPVSEFLRPDSGSFSEANRSLTLGAGKNARSDMSPTLLLAAA